MTIIIKDGASRESIKQLLEKLEAGNRRLVAKTYSGFFTRKKNPIDIQKKLRDQWV